MSGLYGMLNIPAAYGRDIISDILKDFFTKTALLLCASAVTRELWRINQE
jgi:hypothetical protein